MVSCRIISLEEGYADQLEKEVGRDYYDILNEAEKVFGQNGVRLHSEEEVFEACFDSDGNILGVSSKQIKGFENPEAIEGDEDAGRQSVSFSIAVQPESRRKGIARALIESFLEQHPNEDYYIETWVINPHMATLLEDLGFSPVNGQEWRPSSPHMFRPNPDDEYLTLEEVLGDRFEYLDTILAEYCKGDLWDRIKYKVVKVDPVKLVAYDDGTGSIRGKFKRAAKPWQKKLVSDYRKKARDLAKTDYLIVDGSRLLDGHHRGMAMALEGIREAQALDVSEMLEPNPDESYRKLQRQAEMGGEAEDQAWIIGQLRGGRLTIEHLRWAAWLGNSRALNACQAIGLECREAREVILSRGETWREYLTEAILELIPVPRLINVVLDFFEQVLNNMDNQHPRRRAMISQDRQSVADFRRICQNPAWRLDENNWEDLRILAESSLARTVTGRPGDPYELGFGIHELFRGIYESDRQESSKHYYLAIADAMGATPWHRRVDLRNWLRSRLSEELLRPATQADEIPITDEFQNNPLRADFYHGSPYSSGIVQDFSGFEFSGGVLFLTPCRQIARDYTRPLLASGKKPSKQVEARPVIYKVELKLEEDDIFDTRKPEHRKLYKDIGKKLREEDEEDYLEALMMTPWLPNCSLEVVGELPSFGAVHKIKKYLKDLNFRAAWISEGSQGASLAVFYPEDAVILETKLNLED